MAKTKDDSGCAQPPPSPKTSTQTSNRAKKSKPARDQSAIYFGNARQPDTHTFSLSNMAQNKMIVNGTSYATSEHLYHVLRLRRGIAWIDGLDEKNKEEMQAKLHEGIRAIMAEKRSPRRAKAVSKGYLKYLPEEFLAAWDGEVGEEVMWEVLQAKFEADTPAGARARKALLDTGDKQLVQVARHCQRWAVDPDSLEGGNELGTMLEKMRARLRGGKSADEGQQQSGVDGVTEAAK